MSLLSFERLPIRTVYQILRSYAFSWKRIPFDRSQRRPSSLGNDGSRFRGGRPQLLSSHRRFLPCRADGFGNRDFFVSIEFSSVHQTYNPDGTREEGGRTIPDAHPPLHAAWDPLSHRDLPLSPPQPFWKEGGKVSRSPPQAPWETGEGGRRRSSHASTRVTDEHGTTEGRRGPKGAFPAEDMLDA